MLQRHRRGIDEACFAEDVRLVPWRSRRSSCHGLVGFHSRLLLYPLVFASICVRERFFGNLSGSIGLFNVQVNPGGITMTGIRNLLPRHSQDTTATSIRDENNGSNGPNQGKSIITSRWRNELVAAAAEFAGTFMFLFFAFGGTQVANQAAVASNASTAGQQDNSITQAPDTSVLLYISLIFGFSLMVNVWVFFRVSGGLFNPAVSLVCFALPDSASKKRRDSI